MKIGETPINLESCFKNCYDLPSEGRALQHVGSHKYKDNYVDSSEFTSLKHLTLAQLWRMVKKEHTPDEEFRVYFMIAILQEFLACGRKCNTIDTNFLRNLDQNRKNIKGLNWCMFFAKHLINVIVAYKKCLAKKKRVKRVV